MAGIVDLLTSELDYARCDAGCSLSTRASIVFRDTDGDRLYMSPGDLIDREELAALPADLSAVTEIVENVEELRRVVVDLVERRVRVFAPAVTGGVDGSGNEGYLCGNWRLFTAPVMAAVGVSMTGQIPSTRFFLPTNGNETAADREDYAERFFLLRQAGIWTSMLADWTNGDGVGSFEQDLSEYVDRTTLLGDPLRFTPILEGLPRPADGVLASRDAYRREALRASLYAMLDQPNPFAHRWAFAWLSWELQLRKAGGVGVAGVPELAVSVERLRRTVPPDSAGYAGAELENQAREAFRNGIATEADANSYTKHLWDVFHEVGFGEQLASIYNVRIDRPIEEVADLIIENLTVDRSLALPKILARALVEARRVDDLTRVADAMRAVSSEAGAIDVTLWYYRQLIRMRMPKRLIEEAGAAPAPHEDQLSVAAQCRLLEARTHALRSLGRQSEALALLESTPQQVLNEPSTKQSLVVARTQLMRDLGSPAAALRQLETLLTEVDDPQPRLYESLVATLIRFGRYSEAVDYGRAAYARALRDPTTWPVGQYAAQAMWCQAMNGRVLDSDLVDVVLGDARLADPERDLLAATALLISGVPETDATRREFVDRVRADLEPVLGHALAEHDQFTASRALYVSALYDQTYRPQEALRSWYRMLSVLSDEFGFNASEAFLYYAANLIAAGELTPARGWLKHALVNTVLLGNDSGLSTAARAGEHTTREINLVTSAMFAERSATQADLRLVGELRRGMVSRAVRRRSQEPAWRRHGLDDEVVAEIAPRSGRVGVLEWVSDGVDVRALITVVDAAGSVAAAAIPLPDVDLRHVAKRMRSRLSTWRAGRAGDPFDVAEWNACQTWLARLLDDHLAPDDHLVVIPFAGWRQLPWQVAAFDRVSCSYEPGWVALLSTVTGAPPPERFSEGVVTVPRVGDPREITDAMARYVASCGDEVRVLDGVAADRPAVVDLLANVDLATLLTHGYTSAEESEVALMLAADGSLPLAHSVAASSERGRSHRFGWREYAELAGAPQVILSAACSTGGGHIVGLGEHLGLYNVLRQVGLRAYVAPQWDIVAADVLPILGDIRTLLLARQAGLGHSVRQAVRHAIHCGVPAWSAHALILEGDWR